MRNYTNKKRKRDQIWRTIVALILVLFGGFLIWNYFIRSDQPDKPNEINNGTNNTQTNSNDTTKPADNTQDEQSAENDGKTPVQNEGTNPNTAQGFTGFVTSKSVNSTSKQLTIRLTIDQLVSPAGTCTLKLTAASGATITKTAPTFDNPSYSSCQGFDMPLSELSSGKWRINVQVKNSNKSGEIDGGEVNIP